MFYMQLLLENNGIIMQNWYFLSTIALFLQFFLQRQKKKEKKKDYDYDKKRYDTKYKM